MIRKAVENIAKKLFPWRTLFLGSALYLCNTDELLANNCLSTIGDKKASNSQEVEDIICRISPEDRTILERFFKELIYFDCYGYVLFGNKPMAFATFENQDGLFGILLGYGVHNSMMYQRRIQLAKQNKNPLILSHNKGISQNKCVNLTSSAPDHDLLSLVGFPRYAEDPLSKEGQSLHKDYAKIQAELHQLCEEENFLHLTLNRLVQ